MNLFQLGCFTLNSGAKSTWKLECDALTDDDWIALAEMVRLSVGFFSSVEGVPRGGLKLATVLEKYAIIPHEDHESKEYPHLIVDDVLTSGGSMERIAKKYSCPIIGAVIFARGPCLPWIKPLFQMPKELFLS